MADDLKYKAKLDIEDVKKAKSELLKMFKEIGIKSSDGFDTKPMTAFQQGVLKGKDALIEKNKAFKDLQITEQAAKALSAQHKAVIDEQKIATEQANTAFREGKITAQEYALAQKKIVDTQNLAIAAQKEADRQAGEANKRLKEQLALARQEEAQRERNRKKLEQESSAYFQLNKALNNVRKEAKDVLAAMYNLEQQGKKNTKEYKDLQASSVGLVKQTQILDQGLKKIDATLGLHQRNVGNYGQAIEALSPHFARINGLLSVFGTSIDQLAGAGGMASFGTQIAGVGKSVLKFLISPIGLAITALTALYALFVGNKDTVIEFDDKLLDVGKTTGLAGRGLVDLGNAVIELSKKLETVSSAKLLEYATVAGSLGVTGTADILAFSEALAKLEIASNISGEEGAAEIARLLTLTDGGVQNVKAFGDEVVNLGNAFAATEAEILGNAEQISQNTGLYKIGRQEVLAYATATKSVGLEAEMVGSAFGRTLSTFEKVLRTGQGLSELAKVTGMSVEELKANFKNNSSGVFNDFIKGLNGVNESGGSVNEILENLNITGIRDQRVIATLASAGYDTLNKALITVKASSGALQAEFDTASTKLVNQTAKFGIAWDNLVLSIENGQGVIGKASVGVVGFFTDLVSSITPSTRSMTINEEAVNSLTTRYDELTREGQLLGGSFKLSRDKQEELRKVTAELGGLMPSIITKFDQYGNALDINRAKVDKMTKAQRELIAVQNKGDIKNANQAFDIFSKSKDKLQGKIFEGTGFFTDDADIANMRDRIVLMSGQMYNEVKRIKSLGGELTKDQQKILEYYEKEASAIAESGKKNNALTGQKVANSARTKDVVDAEIAALQEQQTKLDIHSKAYAVNVKAIKKLQDELALANGKTPSSPRTRIDAEVNAQRSLQAKIDELNAKGKIKALSNDEEELANVRKKYDDLRKLAVDFNSDKKNIAKGLKVNTSGLNIAQTSETEAIIDKQASNTLKTSLSEQKALYDDYEAYKLKVGIDNAKKLAGNKIDTEKSYLQYLQGLEEQLANDPKAKGGNEAAKEQQLKVLRESIAAETALQEKADRDRYAQALADFVDFGQKMAKLDTDFARDSELLKNDPRQLAVRKLAYQKDVDDLVETNSKKLNEYEKLLDNIEKLGRKEALLAIQKAREVLKEDVLSGAVSQKIAKETEALFDKVTKSVIKGTKEAGEELINLANGIDRVASEVEKIDSGFANLLRTVSNVVGQVGNIKKGLGDFNKPGASVFDKLTSGLGIFGAGVSVLNTLASLFDKSEQRAKEEQYAREKQYQQQEGLNKLLERQISLISEAYGTEKITKYSDAVKVALENQLKFTSQLTNKYTLTGDANADKLIEKANSGTLNKFFNEEKIFANLLKSGATNLIDAKASLAELYSLLDSSKLDEPTRKIIEGLIKAKEAIIDLGNSVKEELTGTSFQALGDDIVEALSRGEDAAKSFEDAIRKAMINSLKPQAFKDELQKFYDNFANLSEGDLTEQEIAILRVQYDQIIKDQKKRQEALEAATGVKLSDTATSKANPTSLAGGIRKELTEDGANKLEGIIRADYEISKKTLLVLEPMGRNIGEIYNIAKSNLDLQVKIEQNTANTVTELKNAVVELKTISSNTKPALTPKQLGI